MTQKDAMGICLLDVIDGPETTQPNYVSCNKGSFAPNQIGAEQSKS